MGQKELGERKNLLSEARWWLVALYYGPMVLLFRNFARRGLSSPAGRALHICAPFYVALGLTPLVVLELILHRAIYNRFIMVPAVLLPGVLNYWLFCYGPGVKFEKAYDSIPLEKRVLLKWIIVGLAYLIPVLFFGLNIWAGQVIGIE